MESFVPLQAKSCTYPQPEIIANSICAFHCQTIPFCAPPRVWQRLSSNILALRRKMVGK